MPSTLSAAARSSIALGLALALVGCVTANGPREYPDVRLVYSDLPLQAPDGPVLFAQRVRQTAIDHCARHGALLTPYHRRSDPDYCIGGVRAEILRALPPRLRALYEAGRSASP